MTSWIELAWTFPSTDSTLLQGNSCISKIRVFPLELRPKLWTFAMARRSLQGVVNLAGQRSMLSVIK